jgi:hypothetical protein
MQKKYFVNGKEPFTKKVSLIIEKLLGEDTILVRKSIFQVY